MMPCTTGSISTHADRNTAVARVGIEGDNVSDQEMQSQLSHSSKSEPLTQVRCDECLKKCPSRLP